jgi:MFS family permease
MSIREEEFVDRPPRTAGATADAADAAAAVPPAGAGTTAAPLDRRFVLAALMLVMVLASMEQTITSTAMPTIIGDLHGLEHYAWVTSVYLLTSTISMPLYGRLADALGRKRVILAAIGLFMLGSVLAASARSMTQLILFRGLQGLGAGGIMPVVLTIAADLFTLKERARIQGFFSAVWGTAALLGPALGAVLVKSLGWRSVFYINLPLGALGVAVLVWKYHDTEEPHPADLDLPGVLGMTVGGVALLALVSGLGPGGWSWATAGILAAVSAISMGLLVRHERRAAYPILSPQLLGRRDIGPAMLASLLFGVSFLCLDTYVPLYVQGGRGGGVTAAAGVVTPVIFTWALSGVVAAPLLVRWGFRKTALAGTTLMLGGYCGLVACAVFDAPHWLLTAVLAVTGFGFGPTSMSALLSAQEAVGFQQRGLVTGAVTFFRSIGGALGVGLLGAMFNTVSDAELERLAGPAMRDKLLDPHAVGGLPAEVVAAAQGVIARSLTWVFVAMAAVAAAQLVVTFWMPRKQAERGGATTPVT